MKRRVITWLLIMALLTTLSGAAAESPHLKIIESPGLVRPGKTELFRFSADHGGIARLILRDKAGKVIVAINENLPVVQGQNVFTWNGFDAAMKPVIPGDYQLFLSLDEDEIIQPVKIGEPGPQITQLTLQDARVSPGKPFNMSVNVNMPGLLLVVFHVADKQYEIFREEIPDGLTAVEWTGLVDGQTPPAGTHTLSVVFLDQTGFAANPQHITLEVAASPDAAVQETPLPVKNQEALPTVTAFVATATPEPAEKGKTYSVPTKEEVPPDELGSDFWSLPVGDFNEEAIWKVMMQPMTVLWGKDQRDTYKLRAARDDSTERENILGEVSYESQGVNIIEQYDDGWSLVEVFNSSYGPDNRSRRGYGDTDELIRGYVRSNELKTIQPRTDYGILIDKLKQRLYIFQEGKLFTELLISTGVPTKQQPWNETPSGEFFMVSRTGDFNAGNLVCRMAMRINSGVLIHEVPYILNEATGYWDYSSQEAQLGMKASHGCIRVQRRNNEVGVNMTWMWNNIKQNTKVLVWDDAPGRYYVVPEDTLALYFNPVGGKYYHLDQNCSSIKDHFLPLAGEMTYAQLKDAEYNKLNPCPYCNPPIRAAEIARINADNGF
jgi:hypothetical protein